MVHRLAPFCLVILLAGAAQVWAQNELPSFKVVGVSTAVSAGTTDALFTQWGVIRSVLPHLARALSTFSGPDNLTPSVACLELFLRTR